MNRLQAPASFEDYQCVVPSHSVVSRGNIECRGTQFIRSSKCCRINPPGVRKSTILIYFLGTGIGRLLTVGFHEVCIVMPAATPHRSISDFACALTRAFFILKIDEPRLRRRPYMRTYSFHRARS
jgi:hypothetical protein